MKIIYVDMDGVLCDFHSAAKHALERSPEQKYPQAQWGFFLRLRAIEGAMEGYDELRKHFDVRILTRPSFRNVNCYTEKAQWVWDKLGYDALEKMIFSGDKSLLKGDYLIDDQDNANQGKFEGEWIRFGGNMTAIGRGPEDIPFVKTYPFTWNWKNVVKHIFEKERII